MGLQSREVKTGNWPGTGTGTYGWQVGVEGGGCFNTTTGKPVNVTNWSVWEEVELAHLIQTLL